MGNILWTAFSNSFTGEKILYEKNVAFMLLKRVPIAHKVIFDQVIIWFINDP